MGAGFFFLAMGKSAGRFCVAKRDGEGEHAEREQESGKKEQDCNGMENVTKTDGAEEGSAHGVKCVSDGIEAGKELEPVGKNGNGKQHASGDTGNSEKEPLGGVAALEEKQIAGGENAKTGEGEERYKQNEENSEPVGGVKRKAEEKRTPSDVDGDAQRGGGKGIERRAGKNGGERGLRDEQMFECAGIAGLFEAAVESVERGV